MKVKATGLRCKQLSASGRFLIDGKIDDDLSWWFGQGTGSDQEVVAGKVIEVKNEERRPTFEDTGTRIYIQETVQTQACDAGCDVMSSGISAVQVGREGGIGYKMMETEREKTRRGAARQLKRDGRRWFLPPQPKKGLPLPTPSSPTYYIPSTDKW